MGVDKSNTYSIVIAILGFISSVAGLISCMFFLYVGYYDQAGLTTK